MPIPNADRAIIEREKLVEYLLNPDHPRGGSKARVLLSLGYSRSNPESLERDLRNQHLTLEPVVIRDTEFGRRFENVGVIETPGGRPLVSRSIWQIDAGTDVPRLLTMFPD